MGIRSALKSRHPVWVLFITFLTSPFFGFMYVNRGRLALAYLAFLILFGVADKYGIDTNGTFSNIFILVINFSCAVYSVYLVKKHGLGTKIKWYAKFAVGFNLFWICFFILILPIRIFYEPMNMPSGSMEPSIPRGDLILIDLSVYGYSKFSFSFLPKLWEGRMFGQKPQRGDIIIFALPTDTSVYFSKRIIGLPGDEIQMKEGNLYINNAPAKNEIIGEYTVKNSYQREVKLTKINETLPEGKSYNILDESKYGTLDETGVYKVPKGHYFVLGDNRDYSQDSRVTNVVGPVPEENIIGRAAYVYYSGVEQKLVFRKIE